MTYRCGFGQGMAELGFEEGPPHIKCDGCGLRLEARMTSGGPPLWLIDQKAPRGWHLILKPSGVEGVSLREDYCPQCRKELKRK